MKKMKCTWQRFSVFLVTLMCFGLSAIAQEVTVEGVVVDSQGEGVIGASVVLAGKQSVGTVTDLDGHFVLKVPNQNASISVSYVGMKTVTTKVTPGKNMRIVLEDEAVSVDEFVVVGFGRQKKESVVGAITQTDSKVLERTGIKVIMDIYP